MDRKESPREESGPAFSTDDEYWLCDECGHGFLEGTV